MGRKSRKHKSHKQKSYRHKPIKRKSKSKKPIVLILAFCLIVAVVVIYSMTRQGEPSPNKVLLSTNMGDITIQLYNDMPITTANFKKLVQQGTYDGTIFHRVIDEFMIQGG
ncbi:MAG: peptidylprolyl isomerase, partial [Candidatus Bathyarchaeota archaeon]